MFFRLHMCSELQVGEQKCLKVVTNSGLEIGPFGKTQTHEKRDSRKKLKIKQRILQKLNPYNSIMGNSTQTFKFCWEKNCESKSRFMPRFFLFFCLKFGIM